MAVKTKLAKTDIDAIILNYDIGVLVDFKGIVEGVENTNYFLTTSEGKFVLTIFEDRVKTSDLPFYEALLEHLYQNHINIPYFIPNKSDSSFFTYKAKRGVIIPFFAGKAKLGNFSENDLHELGLCLGKLHVAGQDFSMRRANPFDIDNCQKYYMNMYMRNHLGEDENVMLRRCFDQIICPNHELPTGIIHADLFPDNVFFTGDKIEAVIDPYFSCYDALIYDVAICASAWCFDENNHFKGNNVLALLRGYNTSRKLTQPEILSFRNYCLLASIRFFLTRVEDSFKQGDIDVITEKDPGEFYQRIEYFYNWQGFTKK